MNPDRLYIGIDIGKESHFVAFLSSSLLKAHKDYRRCPTFKIDNSRIDFERLIAQIEQHGDPRCSSVLMEKTGHYHLALQQYLQEHGIDCFEMHVRKRLSKQKNDKRDAQNLANILYTQLELGVQPIDSSMMTVRRVLPPSEEALSLRALSRHRYEIVQGTTRIKNKLTAILDEAFPEFTLILKDGCCDTALMIRECFPTPHEIAEATLDQLKACRAWKRPGNAALLRLQELARQTIGVKALGRLAALKVEQRHLIAQLRLLQSQLDAVEREIEEVVVASREGAILTSIPGISATQAGVILASIGNIENFTRASRLKGWAGWCPVEDQTGTSKDSMVLSKGGNRMLKHAMYFVGLQAIRQRTVWREIYMKRVEKSCRYDERLGKRRGKGKVLGRIIGDILTTIYTLLKADHDRIARLAPGEELPPPILYNKARKQSRRRKRSIERAIQ